MQQIRKALGIFDIDQEGRQLMVRTEAERVVDAGQLWLMFGHDFVLAAIAADFGVGGR
ncbi:hypothetical protein D3C87_2209790 [compost metagenome]